MSIEPTGASHAQNPPAEWIEALAYWRAVKGERSMYGESIAESPSGTDGTWPNALPLMMVADLQWRTSGRNADHRMTLVNLASALYGALQRVAWTVPECYREPGNVVTMDAITAPQAKAIFTGMGVEPDRVLKAWLAHHCPENTIEPAPAQPAQPLPPTPAPAINPPMPKSRTRRDSFSTRPEFQYIVALWHSTGKGTGKELFRQIEARASSDPESPFQQKSRLVVYKSDGHTLELKTVQNNLIEIRKACF